MKVRLFPFSMSNALCVSFYPLVFMNQEEAMFPRNQMFPEKCDMTQTHILE